MSAGYCTHLESITIRGGKWRSQQYPALCTLIQHPEYGNILYDTGYSSRFFTETKRWPYSLYNIITPVKISEEHTLIHQLQKDGIKPEDISYIIISHFHADHVAGLKDFPNAKMIFSRDGYNAVKGRTGFSALRKAYLSGLLPNDFVEKAIFIEDRNTIILDKAMAPFDKGTDIFGDGSVIAIDLSGHAIGQIGILFNSNEQQVFLVADSCWSSKAYREYKLPSSITYLIHDNKSTYQHTLKKLYDLYSNNKDVKIVPSHCQEIWHEILEKKHV